MTRTQSLTWTTSNESALHPLRAPCYNVGMVAHVWGGFLFCTWSFLTYFCSAGGIIRNHWAFGSGQCMPLVVRLPDASRNWGPSRAMSEIIFELQVTLTGNCLHSSTFLLGMVLSEDNTFAPTNGTTPASHGLDKIPWIIIWFRVEEVILVANLSQAKHMWSSWWDRQSSESSHKH